MQRVKSATHRRDTRLVKLGRRRDEFERCRIIDMYLYLDSASVVMVEALICTYIWIAHLLLWLKPEVRHILG